MMKGGAEEGFEECPARQPEEKRHQSVQEEKGNVSEEAG